MPEGASVDRVHSFSGLHRTPSICLTFPATQNAVRSALASITPSLRTLCADEAMVGTAELVLAEATNNIVEHAYVEVDDGTITLSCFKEPGRIGFVIKDRGKNFPNYEIPPKKNHDLNAEPNALPEGGFGWGLIRDLTTSLEYRRINGQSILRFSIPSTTP
ncbi:ATP-binding protein [Planktotalea sp.]|uniref:ATP-binding protein n=1 Tax=Planktotalea sp. TaxID=2029877 RepID=UPI003450A53E